jgi:hypothetical protein
MKHEFGYIADRYFSLLLLALDNERFARFGHARTGLLHIERQRNVCRGVERSRRQPAAEEGHLVGQAHAGERTLRAFRAVDQRWRQPARGGGAWRSPCASWRAAPRHIKSRVIVIFPNKEVEVGTMNPGDLRFAAPSGGIAWINVNRDQLAVRLHTQDHLAFIGAPVLAAQTRRYHPGAIELAALGWPPIVNPASAAARRAVGAPCSSRFGERVNPNELAT